MTLDQVQITVSGGHGGPGHCSFLRTVMTRFGGPNGGNGGNGGNVIFCGNQNLNNLSKFRMKKIFQADNGASGRNKSQHGEDGEDLIIFLPLGTQIFDENNTLLCDILQHNQLFTVATGGKKGMGNEFFKTSTNRAPRRTTPGLPGETKVINLSLKMLADIGIIGMPNAGKSSFIRNITNSKAEVGSYQFTTLSPNLGVCYNKSKSLVFADLPGIIEDSSKGKGLGIQFLKHIERCKVLLHFIDISDENYLQNFNIINKELAEFNDEILKKQVYICLNKSDMVENITPIVKSFAAYKTFTISNYDTKSYKKLIDKIFLDFEYLDKPEKLPEINFKNSKTF